MSKISPHSEHNYKLCEHLLEQGQFLDWVITTAFYSALHLCQEKIFPFKSDDGQYHPSFDAYTTNNKKRIHVDKHTLMVQLVDKRLKSEDVTKLYRNLKDACMHCRYRNYHVKLEKAIKMKDNLDKIRNLLATTKAI